MIQETLSELFNRDIDRLTIEINAYENEETLWVLKGDIKNTAGNLCMHLIGNLKHFVGHTLGQTNYLRQRENEFSGKETVTSLLQQIEETKHIVSKTITDMSESDLKENFPIRIFDREHSTLHFLMHLSTHLNYHLGQINYHRRLVE
jgi:uncharacterized damage-inducible protein DinB